MVPSNLKRLHLLPDQVCVKNLNPYRVGLLNDRGIGAALAQDLLEDFETIGSRLTLQKESLVQVPEVEEQICVFLSHI